MTTREEIAQARAKMRNEIATWSRDDLQKIANRLDAALGEALDGLSASENYGHVSIVRETYIAILRALKDAMP